MKTFGDQVEYQEWVEEIAENVEQIGGRKEAAEIAITALHRDGNGQVIMFNGMPAVPERAPPSEIFRYTYQEPPYPTINGWRVLAVLLLMQDLKKIINRNYSEVEE